MVCGSIGNLEALASDTHKFESRYLDRLVGPYPAAASTYRERSPIQHVDGFACPLVQFQGLEDRVVPPNQALEVFEAIHAKGLPTACVLFEGEQHGFRRAPNIRRALDSEIEFYVRARKSRRTNIQRPRVAPATARRHRRCHRHHPLCCWQAA
jgi:dipeptidyl aminopeptidase/acylaminoacyl peptidase|eukprot:COSAG01_NODE_6447_length_3661_cov_6.773723_3_plen_153_part_00